MTLARHIREKDWSSLEDAWTELILEDPDPAPALEALELAAQRREISRCLPLVKEHAEILSTAGRPQEAAELLGQAILLGGSPGELARPLFLAVEAAYGGEETWEAFAEIADLRENTPDMRGAWRAFRKLAALAPGRVVYHSKGWGLGTIQEFDLAKREALVSFSSGRRDRFPLQTAVDIFEVLDTDDLRALVVLDPAELKRRLKSEPLEVLRWVCRRNGGRVNHAGLKLSLGSLGVDGAAFTAWWRRTRRQAETSEWFELSGPATKVQVRLLHRAEDPVEGLVRQLKLSSDLAQALGRVRALLGGQVAEEVREAALATLEELAEAPSAKLRDRLGVWLFLREMRGETPERFARELAAAAAIGQPDDPGEIPALWAIFHEIRGAREQERTVDLLREVHGEGWLDEVSLNLLHAAPGMSRALIDVLLQAGRRKEVIGQYVSLLARPGRNPTLLVRLAEAIEPGLESDDLPPGVRRAQCLLQLGVHLNRTAKGNAELTRTRARLTQLLARGKPSALARLLEKATLDDLRRFGSMLEAGIDGPIDRLFTRIAVDFSPEVFRGEERPFWEQDLIWVTRAGLARHEEELRVLRDVKIPANAEAIGKAASYGDLSENSEWEAAIEEQRHLTSRAQTLEEELRAAQLIENAAIPPGRVAPGTAVRVRDIETGEEQELRVLGPWDLTEDDIVSYRSPLGAGLLGKRVGDRARVQLPNGQKEFEVLALRVLELGT